MINNIMPYKDKKKQRERNKRYYQSHKEKIKQTVKEWVAKNKERKKEYQRNYYMKHRYPTKLIRKNIKLLIPRETPEFAELIGTYLGDGCLYDKGLKIVLSNKKHYRFVMSLLVKIFGKKPSLAISNNYVVITLYGTQLPELMGFKGNKIKNKVSIPEWIFNNNELLKACIRGLFDTDGSLFVHSIQGKNKIYYRLSFKNYCVELRESVFNSLKKFGYKPIRNGTKIELAHQNEIIKYMREIGSRRLKWGNGVTAA